MSDGGSQPYPFGDSDRAIERLNLLARLFAGSTVALLERAGVPHAALAGDLGCGPGHTTELIARYCHPRALVGFDESASMVASAAERLGAVRGAEAVVADVTRPLPRGPFDLLHARYLLTHLPEPAAALDAWAGQLRPGGRLLIDEIDHIDTSVEPFARYLGLVAAMMAARGTDLYLGRALAGHRPAGTWTVDERLLPLPQPTAPVARMFALNLDVWRHGPWATKATTPAGLDDLAAALTELASRPGGSTGDIVWHHRQLAWIRPS
jgi:trans-aconitate 2-methyltransferase